MGHISIVSACRHSSRYPHQITRRQTYGKLKRFVLLRFGYLKEQYSKRVEIRFLVEQAFQPKTPLSFAPPPIYGHGGRF